MKKLSILLVILCLLILPAMAMAANPTVEIDNVALPNGYYMASGTNVPVVEKPDGGYAYLKDGVLTLYNYSFTSHTYQTLEVYDDALEIKLLGNNSLKNTSAGGDGITFTGIRLTISGSGSLYVYAPYAIVGYWNGAEALFTGGKVTIEAALHGIVADECLIQGGELTVTATHFQGISMDKLSITGGKVTVSALSHIGIAADVVTITGGTTTVNAEYVGIEAYSTISISGADTVVDLTCTGEEDESLALFARDNLRIDSPLEIVEPEGGVIGYSQYFGAYTVLDANGTLPQHVRIATPAPATPAPAVPATGDHAAVALWCALAVLAMTGAVLIRKRAYR